MYKARKAGAAPSCPHRGWAAGPRAGTPFRADL